MSQSAPRPPAPSPGRATYSRDFYGWQRVGAEKSAQRVVPLLMELLAPSSVIDVGCGLGDWLAEFQRAGVATVRGLDGEWVDADMLRIPAHCFQVADLSDALDTGHVYDLCICLEVAEHLPLAAAQQLVRSLTALAPVIVFSAAIPHQGGVGHVNEQWPDFWVDLFKRWGHAVFDCFRPVLWDDPEVEFWYAQNLLLLVSEEHLASNSDLRARLSTARQPPRLVHPRMHELMQERIATAREDVRAQMQARVDELEAAAVEHGNLQYSLAERISELESALRTAEARGGLLSCARRAVARVPGARPVVHAVRRSLRRLRDDAVGR